MPQSTAEILAERAKTHGPYANHACISQGLKREMSSWTKWKSLTPAQREALEMIAHKIGRILNGNPNYRDHWDDIAGYAKLVADLCPDVTAP